MVINNLHMVSSETLKPVVLRKTENITESNLVKNLQNVSGINQVLLYKNEHYIIFDLFFNNLYNYKISHILTKLKALPYYKLKTLCITTKTQKISIELEKK